MKNFVQKLEQQLDIKIIHSKEPIPFESTYSVNENDQIDALILTEVPLGKLDTLFPVASHLTELSLKECGIDTIHSIYEFGNLRSLDLGVNELSNLDGIERLKALTELSLFGIELNDWETAFKNISALKELKSLNLAMTNVESIKGLQNAKSLERINLKSSWIEGFSDVKAFHSLRSLSIASCDELDFDRIDDLRRLENLEVLDLSGNDIETLEGLKDLSNIRQLFVPRTEIMELNHLENLNKLEVLGARETGISEMKGITELPKLKILDLSVTNIKQIKRLENSGDLSYLKLRGNKIGTIKSIDLKGVKTNCVVDVSNGTVENVSDDIPSNIKVVLDSKKSRSVDFGIGSVNEYIENIHDLYEPF